MNAPTPGLMTFNDKTAFESWYSSNTFRPYSLDKYEAELGSLAYYLNATINTPEISIKWPITITKSESPDFRIYFGASTVGLEHSTITSTKYQQFRSHSLRNPEPAHVVWLDEFKIGGKPKEEYNAGWVGDSAEKEWVELALPRIIDKLEKLNKLHFQRFERNELVLNTVSYLPNLEIGHARDLLGRSLNAKLIDTGYSHSFDSIAIIYGSITYPRALVRANHRSAATG